jgi:hypothetical protein
MIKIKKYSTRRRDQAIPEFPGDAIASASNSQGINDLAVIASSCRERYLLTLT